MVHNLNHLQPFKNYYSFHFFVPTFYSSLYYPLFIQLNFYVSCLAVAAHYNSLEVARILLENGAASELPANNMFTALHIASKKNHLELAQLLLDKGANVDAASVNGTTPLHLACESRHAGMANLLLQNGASINQKSHNGNYLCNTSVSLRLNDMILG